VSGHNGFFHGLPRGSDLDLRGVGPSTGIFFASWRDLFSIDIHIQPLLGARLTKKGAR